MAERTRSQRALIRWVARPLETSLLHVAYYVVKALPIDTASALGGALARGIGPRLSVTRRARRNLERVFPDMNRTTVDATIREMWDNLGRLVAELPHLPDIKVFDSETKRGPRRIEIIGLEHVDAGLARKTPLMFFTAHIGNWEIGPLAMMRYGLPLQIVYRAANNRWADRLFLTGRRGVVGGLIPKGAKGARLMVKALNEGKSMGMLVDQKMNDGIAVPFFGRDAMTAPALAQLALKYDCTVIPTCVERLGGARYRLTFEAPLELPWTGNRHADVLMLMTEANAHIETWIRRRPGQWLWLHRRWPD